MSVQSARVQQIIKGDDVTLTHQIMKSVAYNAELSRAPVMVQSIDLVRFFYALQDQTTVDLIGYPGVVVGSYPASMFTVFIAGNLGNPATRGNSFFQSGLGRTVRAEISRLILTSAGDTTISDATIANIADVTLLKPGQSFVGAGIPDGTTILSVGSDSVILSAEATATATGSAFSAYQKESDYLIDEVDVFERGFPTSLCDTSGGVNPPPEPLNLP